MLRVDRHESSELSWEMVTRAAAHGLGAHVREYTGYTERSARPLTRREVPSGDVTLILSPDTRLGLDGGQTVSSFVAALHDRAALVRHEGYQHGLEVRLTPFGARALFGLPMHELTNRVVRLEDVFGHRGAELVDRLWDLPGWEQRFELLDRLIGARALEAPAQGGVVWAWRRLRSTQGRESVGALVEELGWSHRRLIARFREQVGLPPKTVGRLLRFERVSAALRDLPGPRFAEVALDCGYYDQAHLNRDFRAFAGTTPSEYLAARLPSAGGVAA